jgi:hypothetical protein
MLNASAWNLSATRSDSLKFFTTETSKRGFRVRRDLEVGRQSARFHLRAADHGATRIGHCAINRAQRLLIKCRANTWSEGISLELLLCWRESAHFQKQSVGKISQNLWDEAEFYSGGTGGFRSNS